MKDGHRVACGSWMVALTKALMRSPCPAGLPGILYGHVTSCGRAALECREEGLHESSALSKDCGWPSGAGQVRVEDFSQKPDCAEAFTYLQS